MTEKKPSEQKAAQNYRADIGYRSLHQEGMRELGREASAKSYTLGRVVKVPEVADPSTAWQSFDRRQQELRRVRARPSRRSEVVSRTLAQTGMRASIGRIQRRPLPYKSSPVPMRSGRKRVRRSFFWRLLGALALGVMLVLVVNFSLSSNAFRLEQVKVIGTHNSTLINKIQSMGMQGENIFLLNAEAMTSRIEASPLVASVELDKQLPNQLVVTVVERKPIVLWQTRQGTFSVDRTGMVVASASDTPGSDQLGTVVDSTDMDNGVQQVNAAVPALHPGSYLKQVDIAFAVDALQRIPKVTGINAFKLYYDGTMYASTTNQAGPGQSSEGSYVIESSDGWKAYLGNSRDANPLNNRLLELRALLKLAQQQQLNIGTIDLRYGLRPVFTLQQ